jgi:hypothetical protein
MPQANPHKDPTWTRLPIPSPHAAALLNPQEMGLPRSHRSRLRVVLHRQRFLAAGRGAGDRHGRGRRRGLAGVSEVTSSTEEEFYITVQAWLFPGGHKRRSTGSSSRNGSRADTHAREGDGGALQLLLAVVGVGRRVRGRRRLELGAGRGRGGVGGLGLLLLVLAPPPLLCRRARAGLTKLGSLLLQDCCALQRPEIGGVAELEGWWAVLLRRRRWGFSAWKACNGDCSLW